LKIKLDLRERVIRNGSSFSLWENKTCATLARNAFLNLRGVRGVPLLQYRLADWVRKECSKRSAEYEFMRILLPKSQSFWRKLVY